MDKYKSLLIIIFILSLFLFRKVDATMNELPLLDKIIYVDPGHGGRDPGTMYGKIMEKDINLAISLKLKDELMKKGAIVYMTREDDSDLSSKWDPKKKRGDLYRRLMMYKKANTDVYLSIHINWYQNSSWSGGEILYNPINKNNKVLGEIMMKRFKEDFKSRRHLKTTDLYMYRNTTIPGILIECGFLSNSNERYLLRNDDYQTRLAKSITNGVVEYFETIK